MDNQSLVVLKEVSKQYSPRFFPAISRLTLTLNRGEILALLGPSGCGKTTALRLIAGFEVPNEGTILLNGVPMAKHCLLSSMRRTTIKFSGNTVLAGISEINAL